MSEDHELPSIDEMDEPEKLALIRELIEGMSMEFQSLRARHFS